jgi:hypothetical protein
VKLTWQQVRSRRCARSRLVTRAPREELVDVVRAVGGIQAQLQSAAEIGIGIRVADVTADDVQAELWERRSLVRTWTLRGTIHLHPADELGLWTSALRAVSGAPYEQYGLDRRQADAMLQAFADALDGRTLLREELAAEVAGRVGEWARGPISSGWAFLIGDAAVAGLLCHGPPRGTKVTFARPDQWLGVVPEVDGKTALAEAARRFLAAYGPATHREFRQWCASRPFAESTAAQLFESLRDELVEVDVQGSRAWLLADDADEVVVEPSVRLLPQYDCYVIGFREREHLLWGEARELFWDTRWKKSGRYETPVGFSNVLVDGAIAGKWERRRRGRRLEIEVETAPRLTAAQRRGLEAEAERIGAFLGADEQMLVA